MTHLLNIKVYFMKYDPNILASLHLFYILSVKIYATCVTSR